MRVATNEQDPGYKTWMQSRMDGKIVNVYLDDVEQKFVSLADDELGIVVRCVLNAEGGAQMDPKNPEHIWVETVRGAVRIELVVDPHA